MADIKFQENLVQLGAGIETCLEKKLTTSALVLLYSAIDITSWLAADDPNASVRAYFTIWVEKYLLSAKPLGITALELYSARCGLIHTFTPDSRLVEQRKARRIVYAWGTAKSTDLQELIDKTKWSDRLVAVHVEELYEAWRLGVLAFTKELQGDPSKASAAYERANKFFWNLTAEPFESLLHGNRTRGQDV